MTKFIVVIFPDEGRADEGRRALDTLDEEGSLTVFAAAVLVKDAEGKVSVKHRERPGPRGTGVGALVGGLLGLLGGPIVAAFGATAGALSGGWFDVMRLGVRGEFLEEVSRKLTPGKSAVIAEVAEDRTSPLDLRMEALGGHVLREPRPDFEEDRIEKDVAAEKAALAQLEAERRECEAEIRAKLESRIAETQTRLQAASEQAKAKMTQLEEETEAKIAALEDQARRANDDLRASIDRRAAELREEHGRRSAKLRKARELAKQALDEQLDRELEDTFLASDPPSVTRTG